MTVFPDHLRDLEQLNQRDRLRALSPRTGRDFSSNDYLGLGGSHALRSAVRDALERGVPVGSGGSRLLRGNHAEHEALEAEAATFFGAEASLFFSTGYAANAALLATLPQRGDLVVHDALIHASAHEGMRAGRADCVAAAHNDVAAFAETIGQWRTSGGRGRVWLVVESLYSMDGDRAPLNDLARLADAANAVLIVDEAHATGVFGRDGRGLCADLERRDNLITLHTCGKALGCEGALVAAPRIVIDFLVNRARSLIFSTAPSPLMASAVRAALRIVAGEPDRRAELHARIDLAHRLLVPRGASDTGSQIMPVIIGEDAPTMARAASLQSAGFDVRGIRPPTIPTGTARLRLSITLNTTSDDIEALAEALS